MLSGIKFISRDQIKPDENSDVKRKSGDKKSKHKGKKNYGYSSSDDDFEKIRKGSKKKKWYSSDENSSSDSSGSESESKSEESLKLDKKKHKSLKKSKKGKNISSDDEDSRRSKKRSRRENLSKIKSPSSSEDDPRKSRKSRRSGKEKLYGKETANSDLSDHDRGSPSLKKEDIVRKESGLEWMLRPGNRTDIRSNVTVDEKTKEPPNEEIKKMNPKELNPYFKDSGSGYPDDENEKKTESNQLHASSVVGDGGASWRLKALKRAKEQAAREGKNLDEVVEERWGSLGELAVSTASRVIAPSRAHLHAIKNRKKGLTEEHERVAESRSEKHTEKTSGRDYLRDVSARHPEMRAPKMRDSLSWGKLKGQNMSTEDAELISSVASSLNKFANDGSFMEEMLRKQSKDSGGLVGSHTNTIGNTECKTDVSETSTSLVTGLSTNQLAAKVLQLRMKGKHEEAEKLSQELENMKAKQGAGDDLVRSHNVRGPSKYSGPDMSARRKEDDSDKFLAQRIMQNKKYSVSGDVDDEYDYDEGPSRKSRKKGADHDHKGTDNRVRRVLTQQERCLFCFENPTRPKHLVVSIANFTYLMLPQRQTVVPGHCCIVPMQHESSTRTVDENIWEEIRNFKKCLIMMYAKQDKELVFLETVMGLAQQRRHCLIECIPLPQEVAKEAPLYFKKAIDEAEDEWSQHNAKRLIDTSKKGLRNSIPKDFPYFHVEFGLNKGFVHVIDDEKQFNSNIGLNVIRGMLELPEEDMYRRRRHESVDAQRQAVASFVRDWEPFDWTKQLA